MMNPKFARNNSAETLRPRDRKTSTDSLWLSRQMSRSRSWDRVDDQQEDEDDETDETAQRPISWSLDNGGGDLRIGTFL